MRSASLLLLAPLLIAAPVHATPDAADPVHAYAAAGIGLPELLHIEAGAFVLDRLSVDARFGFVVFNALAGVGATWHFLGDAPAGRPPRHALLAEAQARLNVDEWPPVLSGGGERIGGLGGLATGYAFLADVGFLFRARAGVLLLEDDGFAAGPDFRLSVGWAF